MSNLASIEPLHDILQGDGNAAIRFASSFGNNALPLGGLRNEIGKVMYPQLRQIRSELDDNLRNRNAWLDAFDASRALYGETFSEVAISLYEMIIEKASGEATVGEAAPLRSSEFIPWTIGMV